MPDGTRAVLRRKLAKYYLKTASHKGRAGDRKQAAELFEKALETDPSLKTRRKSW